ncbi:MAG: DUF2075 domain-containing protein [Acidobacteria bacterium]|nr:DUF2075 domain-containing protein [Acidobacteriota bacterium]
MARVVDAKPNACGWTLIFEFTVPRKNDRIDLALLAGSEIVLLEMKSSEASASAALQIERYALLLHYFHKPSFERRIYPIVVGSTARAEKAEVRDQLSLKLNILPTFWIQPVRSTTWASLADVLVFLHDEHTGTPIHPSAWIDGQYHPVPTIIEAARDLRSGLKITDIAHSEASEHEIADVADSIREIVACAQIEQHHAICFLTGVPGSGKTLVGLSLAHLDSSGTDAIHFMSGNGPLVMVLQENFRLQAMRQGIRAVEAKIQSEALIENVHVFARNYTTSDIDRPPSNRVVIFDEAQRAWNKAQNLRKFKRDYSEPEMLLSIMGRHQDWAVVVALIGGGQEINSGEAGLEEWGRALSASPIDWKIYASPEVLTGGPSTAERKLFDSEAASRPVIAQSRLHLRTSNRSLRAEQHASWVNAVIVGDAERAASFRIAEKFPMLLVRNLDDARTILRRNSVGGSRYGLVGSSGAARLRAEGLEPSSSFHANYDWHHWYLSPPEDVRSSYQCEVFATEFEVQGLELDWVGICWGGDFIWTGKQWLPRSLHYGKVTKWSAVKNEEKQMHRRNAYRVLLTRARQGSVIYVPEGDSQDQTRNPEEFDKTAEFLIDCGVLPVILEPGQL